MRRFMFQSCAALTALFATASLAAPAMAAEVIDVNVDAANRMVTVSAFDPLGQSFTAISDTLTSIAFELSTLNPNSSNSAISLRIFAGEVLSGSSLFSTTFVLPNTITSRNTSEFVVISLPDIAVMNGSLYTAVLNSTSNRAALVTGPAFINNRVQGGDAYTGGRLLTNSSSIYSNCKGSSNNCDANFRVTGELVASAIPEPSTWGMVLLGFGFIGGAMRSAKSRKKALASYA